MDSYKDTDQKSEVKAAALKLHSGDNNVVYTTAIELSDLLSNTEVFPDSLHGPSTQVTKGPNKRLMRNPPTMLISLAHHLTRN